MRVACLLMVVALGCDHDHDHADATTETNPIEVGCAHFEHGPHCSSPAAADDDDPCMPHIHAHQHFAVDLDQTTTVDFASEKHATHWVLLGADTTLTVTDAMGEEIASKSEEAPGEACSAAQRAVEYELHDGEVYTLTFTGTGVLDVVVHRVDDAGSHDHG